MKLNRLLIIFLTVLTIECFANALMFLPIQYISKPSLMLILIFYFRHQSNKLSPIKNLITAALLFSWLGDVILLIEKQFHFLFVFGLISFLIAHIFYVVYFLQISKHNHLQSKIQPFIFIGVFAYSAIFYFSLFPYLSVLKIAVLIYCLVISAMLITSLHAFDFKKQKFGIICVVGTILFVISDSILAINRFVMPIPFGNVFVISTYSIGQLLIMEGALRNLRKIKLK